MRMTDTPDADQKCEHGGKRCAAFRRRTLTQPRNLQEQQAAPDQAEAGVKKKLPPQLLVGNCKELIHRPSTTAAPTGG
jgi:hypothetical protein